MSADTENLRLDALYALNLLDTVDPDSLTPREALDLIYKLKDRT